METLRDGIPLGAHVQLASWWRCYRPNTELLISGTNDKVVESGWEVRWGAGLGAGAARQAEGQDPGASTMDIWLYRKLSGSRRI